MIFWGIFLLFSNQNMKPSKNAKTIYSTQSLIQIPAQMILQTLHFLNPNPLIPSYLGQLRFHFRDLLEYIPLFLSFWKFQQFQLTGFQFIIEINSYATWDPLNNTQKFLYSGRSALMDIEGFQITRENRQSFSSGRYSNLSLEALTQPRLSLRQKASLIEIMDLEVSRSSGRKSEFMFLEEEINTTAGQRLSQSSRDNYSYHPNISQKDLNRKSNFKIKHQCTCNHEGAGCNGVHCSCFLTPREICVIGQCCPKCIEAKNNFLRQTRGWQLQKEKAKKEMTPEEELLLFMKQRNCKNMHYIKHVYGDDPLLQNLTFCTCKKSHCQKKYCLCFERGVKCGEFCICLECQNKDNCQYEQDPAEQQKRWQRYAIYEKQQQPVVQIEHDIGQFMHEELIQSEQFNQIMEFEPVNFEQLLQNFSQ